jgi:integrase/recombinase XerD
MTEHGLIVAEYERWLHSWGAAPKTVKARVNLARCRLFEWGLDGMTAENVTTFLGREELARWSRSTYHANLKDFCTWLVAAGYLAESPMDDPTIRKPKRPRSRPRPLTEAEVTRVLSEARGRTRDWLILALCAGLRAHEIAKLRGEDVAAEGIYVMGKGGSPDVLPCHPDIRQMARRYPDQGWWFSNGAGGHITPDVVTVEVGRLFRRLGITGSIHRMRHVYATRLIRSGAHIRRVQRLMRHATLETTAAYTAVDEDELRDAIYALPSTPDSPPPAA